MNEALVERFAKSLYESIVKENLELYKDMYQNIKIDSHTDEKGKGTINFYNDLTDEQRVMLFEIIEQTMIDTVSTVLGIIDGHVTQANDSIEPKLLLNSMDTEGELQDSFLVYVEELDDQ